MYIYIEEDEKKMITIIIKRIMKMIRMSMLRYAIWAHGVDYDDIMAEIHTGRFNHNYKLRHNPLMMMNLE